MGKIFCSTDKTFKNPVGPVKPNDKICFRVKINVSLNPSDLYLIFDRYWMQGSIICKMEKIAKEGEEIVFEANIRIQEINIYKYHFEFYSNGQKKVITKEHMCFDGKIQDWHWNMEKEDWQLTVYKPTPTSKTMSDGIMYQIFPDRFYKFGKIEDLPKDRIYREWGEKPFFSDDLIGMDYFGGNLQGIKNRLEYLKKLGVTVLYLNPIWLANSNHRYNTSDYKEVDPVLGKKQDLIEFIDEAHRRGMIIILDTVLNHTGSDSKYFNKEGRFQSNGAYNSRNSEYYDWYYFSNYPYQYESWWGFTTLPKINQESISFQKFAFAEGGLLDYWYSLGIDGIRLDVADELPNHTLKKIYDVSKRNKKEIIIVGEVWEDASNKTNYGHRMEYFLGNELTSVMNYPVKEAILAYIRYGGEYWASNLVEVLTRIFVENYPREIAYSLMNFLSSHDTVRAITKLAGPEVNDQDKIWQNTHDELSREEYILGRERLKISYLLLYFLPGIPSIFYGDEVGVSGQKDPFCRKCYPWNRKDKKLLRFFKEIGKFRKKEKEFFGIADFEVKWADDEGCIIKRMSEDRSMILVLNRTNQVLDLPSDIYEGKSAKIIFNTKETLENKIAPYSGMILELM